MGSAARPADPPYLRIAAEIRERILSGDLRVGERVLSARQIARKWGVALATATRAMAALRDEGLVETRVGAGTVVSARPGQGASEPGPGRGGAQRRVLTERHILRSAVGIADAEGLEAVSIRRIAAELGTGPMSLYRHVANKDELVAHMAGEVFGEVELPEPGPVGWRAKLELISRLQWELCRRHVWLPRAISFTRPAMVPEVMTHTEWTLRALEGLELSMTTRIREALALHRLVITTALSMTDENDAEQETGVPLRRWWLTRGTRADEFIDTERFPLLAAIPAAVVADLDGMFDYALDRHLDGFAVLLEHDR